MHPMPEPQHLYFTGLGAVLESILIPGLLALMAYLRKSVSISGALGGWVMAAVIYWALGWRGLSIPFTFFVLSDLATRYGFAQKAERGIAQEHEGVRSARNALAKVSAGVIAALLARHFTTEPWLVAYAATFTTACTDTVSSEIGKAIGRRTINPITLQPVEAGTEGAVSMEGTVAGALAAMVCAGVAAAVGFFPPEFLLQAFIATAMAGVLGNWFESLLGTVLGEGFSNEVINFINTLIGGVLGWLLMTLMQRMAS